MLSRMELTVETMNLNTLLSLPVVNNVCISAGRIDREGVERAESFGSKYAERTPYLVL